MFSLAYFQHVTGVYCDNNPESETKHFPVCADERADGTQTQEQEQEQIRLPVSPAAEMFANLGCGCFKQAGA